MRWRLAFGVLIAAIASAAQAQQALRPVPGELRLTYAPVTKFSETVTVDGSIAGAAPAKPVPIKAKLTRTGAVTADGADLAVAQSYVSERPEGKQGGGKGEMRVVMSPAGEVRSASFGKGTPPDLTQMLASRALGAITLKPSIRQGQDIFDLSGLVALATQAFPGLTVVQNTVSLKASGLSADGQALAGTASGALAFAFKDQMRVDATVGGNCLVDVATALMRACDLRIGFTTASGEDTAKGQVRVRSQMDIKR